MSLADDIIAFKQRVQQRFFDKTLPGSIKKGDSGNSFDELADLLLEIEIPPPSIFGYNEDSIPFATTTESPQLILANYDQVYQSTYGNKPTIAVFVDGFAADGLTPIRLKDNQTSEQREYLNDDPTSDILNIVFDYPVATSGFFQISGVAPTAVSPTEPTGVGGIEMNFTEAALQPDGQGGYYLPLNIAANKKPIYITLNGDEEVGLRYSRSLPHPGIYGFANNNSANIAVTVITVL